MLCTITPNNLDQNFKEPILADFSLSYIYGYFPNIQLMHLPLASPVCTGVRESEIYHRDGFDLLILNIGMR